MCVCTYWIRRTVKHESFLRTNSPKTFNPAKRISVLHHARYLDTHGHGQTEQIRLGKVFGQTLSLLQVLRSVQQAAWHNLELGVLKQIESHFPTYDNNNDNQNQSVLTSSVLIRLAEWPSNGMFLCWEKELLNISHLGKQKWIKNWCCTNRCTTCVDGSIERLCGR